MIISNTEEVKMQIRKLGFNFKEFAAEAEIPYPYLIKAINGDFVLKDVRSAFQKYGIVFERKQNKHKAA